MGTTAHEVSGRREAQDHPPGRAIAAAGPPHLGAARHSTRHVLRPVQQAPGRDPSLQCPGPWPTRVPRWCSARSLIRGVRRGPAAGPCRRPAGQHPHSGPGHPAVAGHARRSGRSRSPRRPGRPFALPLIGTGQRWAAWLGLSADGCLRFITFSCSWCWIVFGRAVWPRRGRAAAQTIGE
jgi:hypothetical protein